MTSKRNRSRFRPPWCTKTPREPGKRPPLPDWLDPDRDLSDASYSLKRSYEYRTKIYWATPPWITEEQLAEMKAIYDAATDDQHVDHIVPLCSPLVCGLNVPWNLKRIYWRENLSKSNRHWPDDPYEVGIVPPVQPDFFLEEDGQGILI